MKNVNNRWLLAGGCLYAVALIANAGRAGYDSSDNRMPSPVYHSTNAVTYTAPSGQFTIDSFFDVFTEIQLVSPPDTGTGQTNSFFDVFTEIYLEGPGLAPGLRDAPSQQTIHMDGVPNETWQMEMLQLDLSGGGLPAGVMIRESPTLPSLGTTTIQYIGGPYHIDSFFDVFTELTIDGGQTWIPSNGSMHIVGDTPEPSSAVLAVFGAVAFGRLGVRRRNG